AKFFQNAAAEFTSRKSQVVGNVGHGKIEAYGQIRIRRFGIMVVEIISRKQFEVHELPCRLTMQAELLYGQGKQGSHPLLFEIVFRRTWGRSRLLDHLGKLALSLVEI